jgi:uncharacterized repeat protein (TIGR01451 family)
MLALYRSDVSCPLSFQFLVIQQGSNEVSLVLPSSGFTTHWIDAPGITDIAILNAASSTSLAPGLFPSGESAPALFPEEAFSFFTGILLSEQGGGIDFVNTSNLYNNQPPNPPTTSLVESKVDLALSQSHNPPNVLAGGTLTFSLSISNKGPDSATGVRLTDTLPAQADFISVSPSQGNCGQSSGVILCDLGSIAAGASASVSVLVSAKPFFDASTHTLTNTASVSSTEVDTNLSNNTSSDSVGATAPGPSKLVLSDFPSTTQAGSQLSFTVTAKDQFDNIAPSYRGTIRFTSSDSFASLPSSYTFTDSDGGSHSFSVVFSSSGTQSLTVQDVSSPSLSATRSTSVLPSSSLSLQISVTPGSSTAGGSVIITVKSSDPGYTGTVRFASSDTLSAVVTGVESSQPLSGYTYQFQSSDGGSRTFTAFFYRSGTQSISVADTVDSSIRGSTPLTVLPGSASILAVAAPSLVIAGSTFPLSVTAQDAYGNTATGYTGTVRFTATDTIGLTLPGSSTLVSGTRTFTVTGTRATTLTISAIDTVSTFISGTTSDIAVAGGAAVKLQLFQNPIPAIQGSPFTLTVQALDAYNNLAGINGNPAGLYQGTVQFSAQGATGGQDTSALVDDILMSAFSYTFVQGDGSTRDFLVFLTLGTTGQSVTVTPSAGLSPATIVIQ